MSTLGDPSGRVGPWRYRWQNCFALSPCRCVDFHVYFPAQFDDSIVIQHLVQILCLPNSLRPHNYHCLLILECNRPNCFIIVSEISVWFKWATVVIINRPIVFIMNFRWFILKLILTFLLIWCCYRRRFSIWLTRISNVMITIVILAFSVVLS